MGKEMEKFRFMLSEYAVFAKLGPEETENNMTRSITELYPWLDERIANELLSLYYKVISGDVSEEKLTKLSISANLNSHQANDFRSFYHDCGHDCGRSF